MGFFTQGISPGLVDVTRLLLAEKIRDLTATVDMKTYGLTLFPDWEEGLDVTVGDIYRDPVDDILGEAKETHTTTAGTRPGLSASLWTNHGPS